MLRLFRSFRVRTPRRRQPLGLGLEALETRDTPTAWLPLDPPTDVPPAPPESVAATPPNPEAAPRDDPATVPPSGADQWWGAYLDLIVSQYEAAGSAGTESASDTPAPGPGVPAIDPSVPAPVGPGDVSVSTGDAAPTVPGGSEVTTTPSNTPTPVGNATPQPVVIYYLPTPPTYDDHVRRQLQLAMQQSNGTPGVGSLPAPQSKGDPPGGLLVITGQDLSGNPTRDVRPVTPPPPANAADRFLGGVFEELVGLVTGPIEFVVNIAELPAALQLLCNSPETRQQLLDELERRYADGSAEANGRLTVVVPSTVVGGIGAVRGATKAVRLTVQISRAQLEALKNAARAARPVLRDLWRDDVGAIRIPMLTIDCSTWAKACAEKIQGTVMHLVPKNGLPATGYLPGENRVRGDYQYHSVVVKDGRLYDELHPNGIGLEEWETEFRRLNNWTEAEFNHYYDFSTTPHPRATTR